MIAKDKAEDLFKNYLILFPEFYNDKEYGYNIDLAKQCALITVNELIDETDMDELKYYRKVKQEIEKL